jgi:hypothetical protein
MVNLYYWDIDWEVIREQYNEERSRAITIAHSKIYCFIGYTKEGVT